VQRVAASVGRRNLKRAVRRNLADNTLPLTKPHRHPAQVVAASRARGLVAIVDEEEVNVPRGVRRPSLCALAAAQTLPILILCPGRPRKGAHCDGQLCHDAPLAPVSPPQLLCTVLNCLELVSHPTPSNLGLEALSALPGRRVNITRYALDAIANVVLLSGATHLFGVIRARGRPRRRAPTRRVDAAPLHSSASMPGCMPPTARVSAPASQAASSPGTFGSHLSRLAHEVALTRGTARAAPVTLDVLWFANP
jgi:hypothetical protein